MSRTRVAITAAVAVALIAVSAAMPAAASQGSIPEEVASYAAAPNGLIAALDDVIGVDASGQGIDFREGTEVGALNRVFGFTEAWLDGRPSDPAVELRNEWAAPITIAGTPVGVAIIWINPSSVQPELADFVQGAAMTSVMPGVAADAYLVHDEPREAWFAVVGAELDVIAPGTSGVGASSSLEAYQSVVAGRASRDEPASDVSSVVVPAAIVIAAIVLVITVVLGPALRKRYLRRP